MDTDTRCLRACLLLHSIPDLGQAALRQLLNLFSATAVLNQDPASWRAAGLSRAQCGALDRARSRGWCPDAMFDIERALDTLLGLDAGVLQLSDPDYPALLSAIPDPPPLVYCRGQAELTGLAQVAMVGSRRASPAGKRIAGALAAELVERGLVVTSGLATGIDSASHRGALDVGGASIAVMATGIDRIYPGRHRELAQQLVDRGLLLTEFPPGTPPHRGHFPRRNRIISGLSLATVVVEAALPSGSLLTASAAAEQGRDVGAVPWSTLHPGGAGCLHLLQDGAVLVRDAPDVLDGIGWFQSQSPKNRLQPHKPPAGIPESLQQLYSQLGYEAVSVEQLSRTTGLTPADLQAQLTRLELEGLVTRSVDGIARA